ncbi:UDP-3-O-[3-hydroxymyristoyl] glucosamine N-acyltransferase [Candidatus Magnetoovum chiemensis]|nr:UDP-3-O-[3-hydroxymyristoyl] glucosamine N-acyltransferase [Candidatus Magnetoovum chiemensis]
MNIPQVIVANAAIAFGKLLEIFYLNKKTKPRISQSAFIEDNVKVGSDVSIFPNVYISENVDIGSNVVIYPGVFIGSGSKIGNDCLIYSNAAIRENVEIGNRVIIHSGAVIGSDGFRYEFDGKSHVKIPHVGKVIIEDDVEIGANTTIDRATTGKTIIGSGTKIDNLVQIAHNVSIGKNSIIVAQVGIAGSSKIGDNVVLAGQAGVADHVEIASGTIIAGQSGVGSSLKRGIYFGSPVLPHIQHKRALTVFKKLPELNDKINQLQEQLNRLNEKISAK